MRRTDIFPAWGRILRGRRPLLSIEITRECPLRCPGCYAYEPDHLGRGNSLRAVSDFKGEELVSRFLELIQRYQPIHVSIVGGEPLVRYRELDRILPALGEMGIEVQLVTSAVRPIPAAWSSMKHVHLAVSIDGLRAEHDKRRAPATYDRILKNIGGHHVIVHCTLTRQQLQRPGYLEEFAQFWSEREEVRKIWFSLFTPQHGEQCEERLTSEDRVSAVREILRLRPVFAKVDSPEAVLEGYLRPPSSPEECIFAQATTCVSANFTTRIEPCQFGGSPVCSECGCMASAGLASVGKFRVAGIPLSRIFNFSRRIGERWHAGNEPPISRGESGSRNEVTEAAPYPGENASFLPEAALSNQRRESRR